ncbi:MAG: 1,4-dihydroxy-2-naphthoate octaprenyltransferase [Gammaproteobacteria bacterium]|nr:1,4-dihydroxy-2-naphthoate octaprenyltransferase [Gammaproteobacteria bacterium]NND46544.1 1,4-dihydroxy-2-naphthoate octaprenyltransferase [Woeseiaceae bacterium]NNL43797.1 1,4-dihydroxy-2-naphthoate octaprenyltransferase [Woeseiaceae bacterium]
MPQPSARPMNPVTEDFAGDSLSRAAKRAFHATRPKFFPASVLPVLAGTAWGVTATGRIDILVFLLALLATVCVHAASNVLNDVGDESIGTDRLNTKRIYPYTGGSRFIQTGILSQPRMVWLGTALLIFASLAGIVLFVQRGPVVLLFGLAGIALAVFYSLGPVKLSALGLGETSIVVAFGVLPVSGAAWLQGAPIDSALLLFSLPVGIWVSAILLINEVPDIEADGACGKNTLPVRLGLARTANLYLSMNIAAAAIVVWLTIQGSLPLLAPVVPILLLVLAWRASGGIRIGVEDRESMTRAIESTLAIQTLGCLWLTGCVLFSLWW